MMEKRQFAPKLRYQLSLDQFVPQSHPLHRITDAIDFSFIYRLARPYYSHTGQLLADPVIIFKIRLISYLYGNAS